MIQIYCGDGKGKTTAAIGLAVRAAGRGNPVVIAQFLKSADSGERLILGKLSGVTLLEIPDEMKFVFAMNEEEKRAERERQTALFEKAAALSELNGAGVLVLDEPRRGKEFFRTFDLPAYLRKHFNMFGGTEYRVTLRCAADLEPVMRERFGREPVFCPEDAEHFHFDVPICVSQQFFGWVCGFGGKVEVTAPAAVRAQLHEMVQSLAEQHE